MPVKDHLWSLVADEVAGVPLVVPMYRGEPIVDPQGGKALAIGSMEVAPKVFDAFIEAGIMLKREKSILMRQLKKMDLFETQQEFNDALSDALNEKGGSA